jgi:hypothetical protein
MALLMARLAKPDDLQWLIVVFVMRQGIMVSATDARDSHQRPGKNRPSNCVVASNPSLISVTPRFIDIGRRFCAIWIFCPFAVIRSNLFKVFRPVLVGVILSASFAFV